MSDNPHVNRALTTDPVPTHTVETVQYAAMLRRMVAAYGRRVGDGDPADLAEMLALRDLLDDVTHQAVHTQRARHGFTWGDLARDLKITRQACQQRWGRRARLHADRPERTPA